MKLQQVQSAFTNGAKYQFLFRIHKHPYPEYMGGDNPSNRGGLGDCQIARLWLFVAPRNEIIILEVSERVFAMQITRIPIPRRTSFSSPPQSAAESLQRTNGLHFKEAIYEVIMVERVRLILCDGCFQACTDFCNGTRTLLAREALLDDLVSFLPIASQATSCCSIRPLGTQRA